jgi:hypothetical protein
MRTISNTPPGDWFVPRWGPIALPRAWPEKISSPFEFFTPP